VIQSFADDATGDLFHGIESKRAAKWANIRRVAVRKLDMINAARLLSDLASPPGNRLEALSHHLAGCHSIRINDQWRVVFRWSDGDASEVRMVDYH